MPSAIRWFALLWWLSLFMSAVILAATWRELLGPIAADITAQEAALGLAGGLSWVLAGRFYFGG